MCYQEEPLDDFFPELLDLPSSVTYMSLKVVGGYRITALGCQAGYCKCALVDLATSSESSYIITLLGPLFLSYIQLW